MKVSNLNVMNSQFHLFQLTVYMCIWLSMQLPPAYDFTRVADNNTYTCDELKRWMGSEKHYSNGERKKFFFSLLKDDTACNMKPRYSHIIFAGRSFLSLFKVVTFPFSVLSFTLAYCLKACHGVKIIKGN